MASQTPLGPGCNPPGLDSPSKQSDEKKNCEHPYDEQNRQDQSVVAVRKLQES
jgi:hypothetical protein